MDSQIILYEYEQFLLGHRKDLTSALFVTGNVSKENIATEILKYAVENILGWTPQDFHDNIDKRIIEILKLKEVIGAIDIPPEIDDRLIFEYLATVLYPRLYRYDEAKTVRSLFIRILSGDGPYKVAKFPKDFFTGPRGEDRLIVCFKYLLTQYSVFETIDEMYQMFATSEGSKYLRMYHLYSACESVYEFPLDLLHHALSRTQKNEFLYRKWKFKLIKMQQRRLEKKSEKERKRIEAEEKKKSGK